MPEVLVMVALLLSLGWYASDREAKYQSTVAEMKSLELTHTDTKELLQKVTEERDEAQKRYDESLANSGKYEQLWQKQREDIEEKDQRISDLVAENEDLETTITDARNRINELTQSNSSFSYGE